MAAAHPIILPYREDNTIKYAFVSGVVPTTKNNYDSDAEPLIAPSAPAACELDEESLLHFTATGRPMPRFKQSALQSLSGDMFSMPQLLPKRYTDDSIIPAIVTNVIPSGPPKVEEAKKGLMGKLKGKKKNKDKDGKGLVKVVYMPRREYLKYFARGLKGEYTGTEPERRWSEEELEREFKRSRDQKALFQPQLNRAPANRSRTLRCIYISRRRSCCFCFPEPSVDKLWGYDPKCLFACTTMDSLLKELNKMGDGLNRIVNPRRPALYQNNPRPPYQQQYNAQSQPQYYSAAAGGPPAQQYGQYQQYPPSQQTQYVPAPQGQQYQQQPQSYPQVNAVNSQFQNLSVGAQIQSQNVPQQYPQALQYAVPGGPGPPQFQPAQPQFQQYAPMPQQNAATPQFYQQPPPDSYQQSPPPPYAQSPSQQQFGTVNYQSQIQPHQQQSVSSPQLTQPPVTLGTPTQQYTQSPQLQQSSLPGSPQAQFQPQYHQSSVPVVSPQSKPSSLHGSPHPQNQSQLYQSPVSDASPQSQNQAQNPK
ncbi:hypothetical protein G7Y89_g2658 [Cudoniella acicularis]|uniref:Uncharacterized protein n=1 Tax=Cudoniella acicularis TaxID=354080 RepID=A0A8H4RSV1_9HELO|nr:hypothetical protein G7Y89_g2658 [Cudoniella acicularis]